MKNILFFIIGIALFSCTEPVTKAPQSNPDAEKAAILAVIENESRDFYRKDHDAWSRHYVQTPEVFWACVEKDVTLRASGWEDLSRFVQTWMKDNPEPMDYDKAQFNLSDVKVTLSGDLAFVTMRSTNIQPDGSFRSLNGNRTMKRVDNSWKILSMTSYPNDSPNGSTPNVYVHE